MAGRFASHPRLRRRSSGELAPAPGSWRTLNDKMRLGMKMRIQLWTCGAHLAGAPVREWDKTEVLNWDSWGQERGLEAVELRCREIRRYLEAPSKKV